MKFSYLSDDDILEISYFCINDNWNLYDARLGVNETFSYFCIICNEKELCPGHFGHLDLGFVMDLGKRSNQYILIPPILLRPSGDVNKHHILKHLQTLVDKVRLSHNKVQITQAYRTYIGLNKIQGIRNSLTGKNGIFRNLLLGKRINRSARSVIIPNPDIDIDQISVPESIFETLNLKEGDRVLVNRQPSLTRGSLLAFRLKKSNIKNVFGINLAVTPTFNADFDGDEMNIFAMSQDIQSMNVENNMFIDFSSNIHPIMDCVSGLYIMSKNYPERLMNILHPIVNFKDFIIDGQIKKPLTANEFYKGKESLVKCIDSKDLIKWMNKVQYQISSFLANYGLSVSLDHIVSVKNEQDLSKFPKSVQKQITNEIRENFKLPSNSLTDIIKSGAKGNFINIVQMSHTIGYQDTIMSESNVINPSFKQGMTMKDFFNHQTAVREGIINTNISTARSGYLSRRASIAMTDIVKREDGSIGTKEQIISFGESKYIRSKRLSNEGDIVINDIRSSNIFTLDDKILTFEKISDSYNNEDDYKNLQDMINNLVLNIYGKQSIKAKKCKYCFSNSVQMTEFQTRSADEGATIIYKCSNCSKSWAF